jgi:hypothetical protein
MAVVDLVQHPLKQSVGGGAGYSGMLKLPDLTAQPLNLTAHVFDFTANEIDIRHCSCFPRH